MMTGKRVAVIRADGDCVSALSRAMLLLDMAPVKPGDTVLIKPNLVEPAAADSGQITSLRVIEGVVRYCLDQGARRVIVGEGPGYYQPESSLRQCFLATGVAALARRLGVEWVLFDEHPFRRVKGVCGVTPEDFRVTEFAFECDCFINLPVLKAHYLTGISLAMKNLKGCLKREDKPRFHWYDLNRAVVELCRIIRPTVNVIDATFRVVVEQLGSGCRVKSRNTGGGLILASSDIVAVDAVGSALMGLDPSRLPMVIYGAQSGLGEGNLARIEILGEAVKSLRLQVSLPWDNLKRYFPKLTVIGADRACSGCLQLLVSELLAAGEKGYRLTDSLAIFLGKGTNVPSDASVLVIGDCASGSNEAVPFVPGCPPERERIRLELMRRFSRL